MDEISLDYASFFSRLFRHQWKSGVWGRFNWEFIVSCVRMEIYLPKKYIVSLLYILNIYAHYFWRHRFLSFKFSSSVNFSKMIMRLFKNFHHLNYTTKKCPPRYCHEPLNLPNEFFLTLSRSKELHGWKGNIMLKTQKKN